MDVILKCNSRERFVRYINNLPDYLVKTIWHRDLKVTNDNITDDMFPCYLFAEFMYPSCGYDSVDIAIVKTMEDIDLMSTHLD